MVVNNGFTLSAVKAGATLLPQVRSTRLAPDLKKAVEGGDGSPYASFVGVNQANPSFAFTSRAISILLTKAGMSGCATATATPLVSYWQAMMNQGLRASGSVHVKLQMNDGFLFPEKVSASQTEATVDMKWLGISDGINDPYAATLASALTDSPMETEEFVCGPVYVNGTAVPGIQSLDVDFGLNVVCEYSDGLVFPTKVWVEVVRPSISFTTLEMNYQDTVKLLGLRVTSIKAYLRKMATTYAARVPDATAQHVGFWGYGGLLDADDASVSHPSRGALKLVWTPQWDGTNAVMEIKTATAIAA
jgi:hypothetical protein